MPHGRTAGYMFGGVIFPEPVVTTSSGVPIIDAATARRALAFSSRRCAKCGRPFELRVFRNLQDPNSSDTGDAYVVGCPKAWGALSRGHGQDTIGFATDTGKALSYRLGT